MDFIDICFCFFGKREVSTGRTCMCGTHYKMLFDKQPVRTNDVAVKDAKCMTVECSEERKSVPSVL